MTGLKVVLGPVPDWHFDASCAEVDPALFFPAKGGDDAARAKAICRGCSVREECLDAALAAEATERSWGIRGGLTPRERRRLAAEQRAAA